MKCTWLPRSRMLTPFCVRLRRVAVEVGGPLLELGEVLDASSAPAASRTAAGRSRRAATACRCGGDARWGGCRRRCAWRRWCGRWRGSRSRRRPDAACRLRRSSVALNCCWGNGVTSSRRPSSCLGFRMSLNSSLKLASVTSLPLRDVAQVGPRRQIDRRRELGQQMLRQVEVEVEARQVAVGLLLGFVDQRLAGRSCRPLRGADAAAERSRPARGSCS